MSPVPAGGYSPVLRTSKRFGGGAQLWKDGAKLPVKIHIQNQSLLHF